MIRTSFLRASRTVAPRMAMRMPMCARFQSTIPRGDIENRVLSVFKTYTQGSDKLSATSTFQDLGLDSLDAVELMVAVEEEFGIEIPEKESDEIRSVKDAVDYIAAQSEAR
ncbi:Putative acyl carrier protein, mitochondrial [Wickerhamiella sorbophila]|uniref:Acyl carrier protein n=1 Tax=Wickerhamiella sorbophila TaxID=45607 RepID=A0A2T0FLN6_9ASCO|nr:Putative acyl carrier protein, mitochondrial [Wickerhamiella sorbophila]PRT55892.1 Putative acyl carrier protein, mitochondrial [Wickerhamiella sorbophila]